MIASTAIVGALFAAQQIGVGTREDLTPALPNFLVIVIDDVGTDMIGAYGDPEAPCTPRIDQLANVGVRFTRAYVSPSCSPTRAQLLTGRHGFRTGVGNAIRFGKPGQGKGLPLGELTLAEHLRAYGYSTASAGKWHLKGAMDPDTNPNEQGFDEFRGTVNPMRNYNNWDWTVNGVTQPSTEYITTRTTIDALRAFAATPAPWFVWVSFNAAHAPYHEPPVGSCASAPGCFCPTNGSGDISELYRAMVESVDAHAGVVVDSIAPLSQGPLYVILIGDNGTPVEVAEDCPKPGKGLLYEGGIRVPWVVVGPGITPSVSPELVSGVDLFATVCDLAGVPVPPEASDSLSLMYLLQGGAGFRSFVYAERFHPIGFPFNPTEHRMTVIDDRWKLIKRFGAPATLPAEEFYDLSIDPCEMNPILPPYSAEAFDARAVLEDYIDRLGV